MVKYVLNIRTLTIQNQYLRSLRLLYLQTNGLPYEKIEKLEILVILIYFCNRKFTK